LGVNGYYTLVFNLFLGYLTLAYRNPSSTLNKYAGAIAPIIFTDLKGGG